MSVRNLIRVFVICFGVTVAGGAFGYTLSGTVYGNGQPLAGASVKVTLAVDESAVGQATTDQQGFYAVTVEDGTYNMLVTAPEGASGYGVSIIQGIVISGADVTRNFALIAGSASLSGVVTLSDGSFVKGAHIYVYDTVANLMVGEGVSNEVGEYYVPLISGVYTVAIQGYGQNFIGSPQSWVLTPLLKDYAVSGRSRADFTLPIGWLHGKAMDSNGAPIEGVDFRFIDGQVSILRPNAVWEMNHYLSAISNESGSYWMGVFNWYYYDLKIVPPIGSGFVLSTIKEAFVSGVTPLDVIFQKPDLIPPKFIAGPIATNISQNQATLVWETDEPARGSVTMAGNSITEDSYRTQHGVLLTGLTPSTDYTAIVTATDRSGNGPTTASATFKTLDVPDTTSPVITAGPTVAFYDPYTTVINWETNEPATTRVSGDATYEDGGFVKIHAAELRDLTAAKEYKVTISSTDAAGNAPVTRDISFITPSATEILAPVITKGPWSIDITSNAATIAWETDEPANSGVSYNDGTAYEVLNDDALTLGHAVRLTGLKPNTSYNVTVSSKDGAGNGPTLSEAFIVQTLAESDTQAPVFLNPPVACNVNQQLIQLCFDTDEPSSAVVQYGVSPDNLNKSEATAQLIQQHTLPINGLAPATPYYFRVSVKDQAGNEAVSDVLQVTTLAASSSDPEFVSAPLVSYQGEDRAVIEWETDRPCTALVEYGVKNYNLQVSSSELSDKHSLVLPNLKAATTYQFRVTATDVDGRKAVISTGSSANTKLSRLVTASATSGEITTVGSADETPPSVSALEVTEVDGVIEIRWSTNEAADSRIYFGKKAESVRRVAGGIDFATKHKVRLPVVTPASDYSFRIVSVDPAGNVYASPDYDLTASPSSNALTVSKSGSGTVVSSPAGINCGDDCTESYTSGTVVTLTATPSVDYTFSGWGGSCSGTGECVVTMSAAKNVTAAFTKTTAGNFPLTVTKSGNGAVVSSPIGIDCGSVCGYEFRSGTAVTLVATPDPGYLFNGWSGDCSGTSNCVLAMTAVKAVTATFIQESSTIHQLSVSVIGNGMVTSSPAGINCGSDCAEGFSLNTPVILTANPLEGYSFAGWEGDCNGSQTCNVTMNSSKSVSARFVVSQWYRLKVSKQSNGSVVSTPEGINCGMANKSCNATFLKDTVVTLMAQPAAGFKFSRWKGCTDPVGNICAVSIKQKVTTVTPVFKRLPKYKLTLSKTKNGVVLSSPVGLKCSANAVKCSAKFTSDTEVTLALQPSPGHTYIRWSGACDGVSTDTCSVRMDSPKTVGAVFQ